MTKQSRILAVAALMGALPLMAQEQPAAPSATTSSDVVSLEKFEVTALKSFSDQAIAGSTPVAFTEIGKATLEDELASQDIPLALNASPSVFATTDGGGAGDARVNVRGFSQRNVSILINGVPTNDIENGWLYWSNWDGLGDVTSTIQMQRGLSNVTLPTPSVGGTMNIITDVAAEQRGGSVKLEAGSDGFMKATAVLSTGLIDDKLAITVGGVMKQGDGYVNGTWTKGQGYYFGATYLLNKNNRIELFAIGSPQKHGQRSFASNIAAYDIDYARKLGYTEEQIFSTTAGALKSGPVGAGANFNPNMAPVSSYNGAQYYWGGTHSREKGGFINERENYFHKPQINLNWYSTLSDQLKLATVVYYSGGRGGGSGTLYNGSSSSAFAYYPNSDSVYGSAINWDAVIASNAGNKNVKGGTKTIGQSLGILRNSVNNQDQFGLISKLSYELSDSLTWVSGIDWRTAKIDHFREVRDLLGGSYYLPTAYQVSEFTSTGTATQMGLGDKVDYYNTNTVDWLGLFTQAQYKKDAFTAFGVYGYSLIDYGYVDHFRRDTVDSSKEYEVNAKASSGHQIKGGVNYAITPQLSVYANAGWVSKAPNFDGAINDVSGILVNATNEEFTSFELGARYETPDRKFNISAGLYSTQWRNRTFTRVTEVLGESGGTLITYLRGVNSEFMGLEVESAYRPTKWLRFDVAASFGDWTYTNDIAAEAFFTDGRVGSSSLQLYLKDLKVGDAPQTQVAYAVTVFPVKGLSVKLQGYWYDRYWSDFTPDSRTYSTDRAQSWQIPSYSLYNLHINYRLPLEGDIGVTLFAHVTNLFDKTYVSDATDESSYESVYTSLAARHTAQRAEVFLGRPLTVNAGVKISF